MATDYARALGARLRAIRQQQGLSLHGVEEKSQGRWKAVVSARTSAATAPSPSRSSPSWPTSTASRCPSCSPTPPPPRPPSRRRSWSSTSSCSGRCPRRRPARSPGTPPTIQAQRGDYNGRILSIRQDDLRTLAVIYDEAPSQLADELINWGVLNPEARRALEG